MNFENFKEAVKEKVNSVIGSDCTIEFNDITKNNGIILCGMTIKSRESNIGPTIYLNNYYMSYKKGYCELDKITDEILEIYMKNKVDHPMDMSIFTDYSRCRKTLGYRLINTEKNKELLKDIPHVEFLDLSIVFESILSEIYEDRASILIHNNHLQAWGITQDKLSEDAYHNAPLINEYDIISLEDILCDMPNAIEIDNASSLMFILSNKKCINGAACMLYPGVLKNFSRKIGRNMYIIPSSVHEVLLIPETADMNAETIRNMIQEVNDTQVAEMDILSYSVYYYDMNTDKVTILY